MKILDKLLSLIIACSFLLPLDLAASDYDPAFFLATTDDLYLYTDGDFESIWQPAVGERIVEVAADKDENWYVLLENTNRDIIRILRNGTEELLSMPFIGAFHGSGLAVSSDGEEIYFSGTHSDPTIGGTVGKIFSVVSGNVTMVWDNISAGLDNIVRINPSDNNYHASITGLSSDPQRGWVAALRYYFIAVYDFARSYSATGYLRGGGQHRFTTPFLVYPTIVGPHDVEWIDNRLVLIGTLLDIGVYWDALSGRSFPLGDRYGLRYRLIAQGPQQEFLALVYDGIYGFKIYRNHNLWLSGLPVSDLHLMRDIAVAPQPLEIQGSVVFPGGQKLKNVDVSAFRLTNSGEEEVLETVPTDSDGNYTLEVDLVSEVGLYAELTYHDPARDLSRTIKNYFQYDRSAVVDRERAKQPVNLSFPYPVVLQGGLAGGITTWDALETWFSTLSDLGQAGLPSFISFPIPSQGEHPLGYNNSFPRDEKVHSTNAIALRNYVHVAVYQELFQHLAIGQDLPKLDLVAHSMGALIARAWLKSGANVRKAISADGVHGGVSWDLIQSSGFSELVLNGYELPGDVVVEGWNHHYKDLSGRWLLYSATPEGWVTPDDSALGIGRRFLIDTLPQEIEPIVAASGGFRPAAASHTSIKSEPQFIIEFALFLVDQFQGSSKSLKENRSNKKQQSELSELTLDIVADSGASASQDLYIDSNSSITVNLLLSGLDASADLSDSSGSIIPPDLVWEDLEANIKRSSFVIDNPSQGMLTLSLNAGTLSEAQLSCQIQFDNDRKISGQSSASVTLPGSSLLVQAELLDQNDQVIVGSNGEMLAKLPRSDGSVEEFELFDDGQHSDGQALDGLYANTVLADSIPGRYLVHVEGQTDIGAGEIVQRSGLVPLVSTSEGAYFTGLVNFNTLDSNNDGLIDTFSVEVRVRVDQDDHDYQVQAELVDSSGNLITELQGAIAGTILPTQPGGGRVAQLVVDISELHRYGQDGPWTVRNLILTNSSHQLTIDGPLVDYITPSLSLSQFVAPQEPSVHLVLPSSGPEDRKTTVHLSGNNLDFIKSIEVNGQVVPFTIIDAYSLTIEIPKLRNSAAPKLDQDTPLDPHMNRKRTSVDIVLITDWDTVRIEKSFTYQNY